MTLPTPAQEILGRTWLEMQGDQQLAPLVALIPTDRAIGALDVFTLLPAVLPLLRTPEQQLQLIDAGVRAYARAAGLHFTED